MRFNENGFPIVTGATDAMDSAHLAGLMAFVGHEKMNISILEKYMIDLDTVVRCPDDYSDLCPANPNNFTRDQLICYVAGVNAIGAKLSIWLLYSAAIDRGYRAQNTEKDIPGSTKKFPDGADILDPSHIGYMRLCAGLEATWFQRLWMKAKIIIDSKFSPMSEPNNIIVMSIIYGYAGMLKKWNPKIAEAVRLYWCNWRNEQELAEMLIKKLESHNE